MHSPSELRLTFNEPLELPFTKITLSGSNGRQATRAVMVHPDSPRVAIVELMHELAPGEYTVDWQVVGRDGHPVRGQFIFEVLPGANDVARAFDPVGQNLPPEHHQVGASGTAFSAASWPYAMIRWLAFAALLASIGAVTLRIVLRSAWKNSDSDLRTAFADAARRAAHVGFYAALLLSMSALLRLLAQSYALHGRTGWLSFEMISTMLIRTMWGRAWLIHAVGLVLATWGLRRAALRDQWWLAGIAVVVLAFSMALSGHAAAVSGLYALPIAADAVHVLAASGWLGGLFVLVVAGSPALATLHEHTRGEAVATLVNAFSPIALACAGLLVSTGILAAWIQLGSVQQLWSSAYGKTLLIKLVLLTGVFGTGAYNWRRVRPALGSDAGTSRLQRSATAELAIGFFVLGATAVLVAAPTPD